MKKDIKNFIKYRLRGLGKLSHEINNVYSIIPIDFGGGCSLQKGLLMGILIKEYNLKKTADIGVYRGRSLFPQAIAHKMYSDGIAYGIDPYGSAEAVQNDRPEIQSQLDSFVANTDFEELFNETKNIIKELKYEANCNLIRKKSSDAVVIFKENSLKFDMVHIDGNHDTKFVVEDVNNYMPLLKEKSFIVLDDISWDSVQPAISLIEKEMDFIGSLVDRKNDFSLFARGFDEKEIRKIKSLFKKVT